MRRHFKTRHRNIKYFKVLLFGLLIYSLSNYLFLSISHDFLFIENPIYNFRIDRDKLLLKMGLNYKEKKKDNKDNLVFNEIVIKPKIYLYNTHQSEEYDGYTLLEASKLLKECLDANNIEVIMDDVNIEDIIHQNNLKYKDSYKITRSLIQKQDIDSIDLFIDLHRDSAKKKVTTATINGINYAKYMFVVGGSHEKYMDNYRLMDDLNKKIKNINPDLSRGIFLRKSSDYNQDISRNVILIELGGVENTKEEVNNSIKLLSEILTEYLNE